MRKTYAYNSIFIGFLLGLWVYVSAESILLAILTCIGVSVVGFILIRLLENLLYKGADKAVDAAGNAIKKHMEKKRNRQ